MQCIVGILSVVYMYFRDSECVLDQYSVRIIVDFSMISMFSSGGV